VAKVTNNFFGDTVTVAGLLTAKDIIEHIKSNGIRDTLLIPEVMLNAENRFLDDVALEDLESRLKQRVIKLPVDGKLFLEALKE
jgi:NifB/MoaA-like Fe-S oxidoreductase